MERGSQTVKRNLGRGGKMDAMIDGFYLGLIGVVLAVSSIVRTSTTQLFGDVSGGILRESRGGGLSRYLVTGQPEWDRPRARRPPTAIFDMYIPRTHVCLRPHDM
jgi:hypothetical protein